MITYLLSSVIVLAMASLILSAPTPFQPLRDALARDLNENNPYPLPPNKYGHSLLTRSEMWAERMSLGVIVAVVVVAVFGFAFVAWVGGRIYRRIK